MSDRVSNKNLKQISFRMLAAAFLAPLSLAQSLAADPGSVAGRIFDADSGMSLREAALVVLDTDFEVYTNLDGRYIIEGLEPGLYTLRAFRANYQSIDVQSVEILANEVTRLDIPMRRHAPSDIDDGPVFDLGEFVVSVEEVRGIDSGLLELRQTATSITDGIGSDTLSRFALSDASEALIKVVGTSVVGGKYAVVRGLGDRYTNVLFNGFLMPSADPDRRAVQLDQFPSSIIENIVTSKSFSPDQPGSFAGGSINIRTIEFPYEFFAKFSAKTGFNTNVLGNDILTVPGGGRDWLGRDDGTRALPAMLRGNSMPGNLNPTRIRLDILQRNDFSGAEELNEISQGFHNEPFFPRRRSGGPDFGWSASVGDRLRLNESGRNQLSYVAAINYDRSTSHYDGGQRARFAQVNQNFGSPEFIRTDAIYTTQIEITTFGRTNPDTPQHLSEFLQEEAPFGITRSSQNVDWSAFGQLIWQPSGSHEISLRVFHNQSASDRVERGLGEALFSDSSGDIRDRIDLLYTERGVTTAQLAGKTAFLGRISTTIDWRVGKSRSTQKQPDYRFIEFKYVSSSNNYIARTDGTVYNRFFRELAEDGFEYGIDLTFDLIDDADRELTFKLGGQGNESERINRERAFNINLSTIPQAPENIRNFPAPVGLISRELQDVQQRTFLGSYMSETPSNTNYDGEEEIRAAYLMGNWRFLTSWRIIAGARIEKTSLITEPLAVGSFGNVGANIDQTDLLPSINLSYSFGGHQKLRLGYSRTLARPIFRELAPIRVNDFFRRTAMIGNTSLKLSNISNYDIRWEFLPESGNLYAISIFYKEIENPIEYFFDGTAGAIRPQNLESGEVYGIEIEMRRDLEPLFAWLRGVSIGINGSLTESSVIIPEQELTRAREVNPDAPTERPLYGQSPYLLNIDLTWEQEAWRSVFTLAYNLFGDRLDLVQGGAMPDIYERRLGQLNLIYNQQLGENWNLRLTAKNLLNPEFKKSLRHAGEEFIYEGYRSGRSFGISLGYSY